MSHPRPAPFKLDVIVVGGCPYLYLVLSSPAYPSLAIAGLSMAIGLAMSGHSVRVLEKSPSFGKPPGGVRLPPNVTKILVQWGLGDELRRRGSLMREGTHLWDCKLFDQHSHSPTGSLDPLARRLPSLQMRLANSSDT